ncbi:hypothetical protein DENSPDRAFT_674223 [Dentipellis sp. KUC8613]|nr:hypothetical protein DENSPDRAFT_674223 [Dentipellis sp. KUC8613]
MQHVHSPYPPPPQYVQEKPPSSGGPRKPYGPGPGPSPPHPSHPHIHSHQHQHQHVHHVHPSSGGGSAHTHVLHHGHTPHPHPHPHQHPHQHQLQQQQPLPHPLQHPHPHPHPHSHQILGPPPYARRTPPPPPAPHMHGYPPHGYPGSALTLMPAPAPPAPHLGAFVHPASPFPYTAPGDARATLLIPATFLPAVRPGAHHLWGGVPGAYDARRVYTDDSDVLACVVHAGFVRWSVLARARREGRDLRVEVRMGRELRYVGGVGVGPGGVMGGRDEGEEEEGSEDDDGRGVVSGSWGNGHDGGGFEILGVQFLEKGTAHKAPGLGIKNRKQRLREYAEGRRAVLGLGVGLGLRRKRPRRMMEPLDANTGEYEYECDDPTIGVDVDLVLGLEHEVRAARMSVVFGGAAGGPGFKYDPDVLRDVLFARPPAAPEEPVVPPRKRRRVAQVDESLRTEAGAGPAPRDVVLETACERFVVRAYEAAKPDAEDKENHSHGDEDMDGDGSDTDGSGRRRWAIYLVGGTAGAVDKGPEKAAPAEGPGASATAGPVPYPPIEPEPAAQIQATPAVESTDKDIGVLPSASASTSAAMPLPASSSSPDTPAPAPPVSAAPAPQDALVPPESKDAPPAPISKTAPPPRKTTASESTPTPTHGSSPSTSKPQLLQRDLTEANFDFAPDEVRVLGEPAADGSRSGWAIEVRRWWWAPVGDGEGGQFEVGGSGV